MKLDKTLIQVERYHYDALVLEIKLLHTEKCDNLQEISRLKDKIKRMQFGFVPTGDIE